MASTIAGQNDRLVTSITNCLEPELPVGHLLPTPGYRQVFLGGADSGFSGKRLFLDAHGVRLDDLGWERWNHTAAYGANAWGLHDTDLMREGCCPATGTARSAGPIST